MQATLKPPAQKRVLIIDDEAMVCKIVERLLRGENYAVTVAMSGREGVRQFDRDPFDVVISNCFIADTSGDDVALAIKGRAPETPIIRISGGVEPKTHSELFAAFLPKPFTRAELLK